MHYEGPEQKWQSKKNILSLTNPFFRFMFSIFLIIFSLISYFIVQMIFIVQANDGQFATICNVNITIRDVNNHSPQFYRQSYSSEIAENAPIGKYL